MKRTKKVKFKNYNFQYIFIEMFLTCDPIITIKYFILIDC